jgi:hypothetical protein
MLHVDQPLEEVKMIPKKHGRVTIKGDDGKEHSGYYHVENYGSQSVLRAEAESLY